MRGESEGQGSTFNTLFGFEPEAGQGTRPPAECRIVYELLDALAFVRVEVEKLRSWVESGVAGDTDNFEILEVVRKLHAVKNEAAEVFAEHTRVARAAGFRLALDLRAMVNPTVRQNVFEKYDGEMPHHVVSALLERHRKGEPLMDGVPEVLAKHRLSVHGVSTEVAHGR